MTGSDDAVALPSHFARSLTELRGASKWMVASASAVAAVLVAGFQITDITALDQKSGLSRLIAVAAAAVALLLVLFVIVGAARVLIAPRPTARDLSKRELTTGGQNPAITPADQDRLVSRVLRQRTYLLGEYDDLNSFYVSFVGLETAYDRLTSGEDATVKHRTYRAGVEEDHKELLERLTSARLRVERLEDAAQLFEAEDRFKQLLTALFFGSILFVCAVGTFAWITQSVAQTSAIKDPLAVTVIVRNPATAGLDKLCRVGTLEGVAVAGTLDRPTVVTKRSAGCPPTMIRDSAGVLVIPTPR